MLLPLTVALGLICCMLLARRIELSPRDGARFDAIERALGSRWIPALLGALNAILVWWWTGWSRRPAPVIHDEAAYLLQAELFAAGRWTAPAPPLPEFFAQMHVLTEPVLASKYPPGFSLLLTPFAAIEFPALALMVFGAITGGLIFTLARRGAGTAVALLTWILWSSSSAILRYQASFLSQSATLCLWLAMLYLVLDYRTHHRQWSLVAMGACIGTLAITRPLTAVALFVPVSIVVVREVHRANAWKPFAAAAGVATVIMGIVPLQNHMTTADWRRSPMIVYAERYAPFDFPGFGYRAAQSLDPLPSDLDSVRTFLTEARRQHTLPKLPATLAARAGFSAMDMFSGWRLSLLGFALLGALVMPPIGLFALLASVGLLLTYALHAHWPFWTAYYVEGYPAFIFASAVGLRALTERLMSGRSVWKRWPDVSIPDMRTRTALIALSVFLLLPAAVMLPRYQSGWQRATIFQRRFVAALSFVQRQSERSIVFVDYGQNHDPHASLVWNVPDTSAARTWIAYERGYDDVRLMRLAPDRQAYIFRADVGQLSKLPALPEIERFLALRTAK